MGKYPEIVQGPLAQMSITIEIRKCPELYRKTPGSDVQSKRNVEMPETGLETPVEQDRRCEKDLRTGPRNPWLK